MEVSVRNLLRSVERGVQVVPLPGPNEETKRKEERRSASEYEVEMTMIFRAAH